VADVLAQHDYQGRSSAPGSLSLWVHNLKEVGLLCFVCHLSTNTRAQITLTEDFVPEGCPADFEAHDAVTMGAGTQWLDAYAFAEAHNITIPGVRPQARDAPYPANGASTG
jgi:hypothetical protein